MSERDYPSLPRYLVSWRPFDFERECTNTRGDTLGAALLAALIKSGEKA